MLKKLSTTLALLAIAFTFTAGTAAGTEINHSTKGVQYESISEDLRLRHSTNSPPLFYGEKYIGNKPKTECTSTAKYMQIDTVLFRRHWLFGWGSPTEHTGRAYNTHKFKHRGVARKCNGYKKHDWRAVNTHFIIDKYGCKIMLYSSTEKEGVSCS